MSRSEFGSCLGYCVAIKGDRFLKKLSLFILSFPCAVGSLECSDVWRSSSSPEKEFGLCCPEKSTSDWSEAKSSSEESREEDQDSEIEETQEEETRLCFPNPSRIHKIPAEKEEKDSQDR